MSIVSAILSFVENDLTERTDEASEGKYTVGLGFKNNATK